MVGGCGPPQTLAKQKDCVLGLGWGLQAIEIIEEDQLFEVKPTRWLVALNELPCLGCIQWIICEGCYLALARGNIIQ